MASDISVSVDLVGWWNGMLWDCTRILIGAIFITSYRWSGIMFMISLCWHFRGYEWLGYRYRKLCVIFRGSMMLLDILFSHYSVICVRNEGGWRLHVRFIWIAVDYLCAYDLGWLGASRYRLVLQWDWAARVWERHREVLPGVVNDLVLTLMLFFHIFISVWYNSGVVWQRGCLGEYA